MPTAVPVTPPPTKPRPYWLPDTQGFLAIAIIVLMGTIVMFLLHSEPKFDDKTQGVLMIVLGVMTGCLKDVYSFFFGSSRGEDKKGDVISTIAQAPPPPVPVVIARAAPDVFSPWLSLKGGAVIKTIEDALAFVTAYAPPNQERAIAKDAVLKILANGAPIDQKAEAFRAWTVAEGLVP